MHLPQTNWVSISVTIYKLSNYTPSMLLACYSNERCLSLFYPHLSGSSPVPTRFFTEVLNSLLSGFSSFVSPPFCHAIVEGASHHYLLSNVLVLWLPKSNNQKPSKVHKALELWLQATLLLFNNQGCTPPPTSLPNQQALLESHRNSFTILLSLPGMCFLPSSNAWECSLLGVQS